MTVSIIIAVKTWQKNLEECVGRCLELDYPNFEILILPDNPIEKNLSDPRIRIIPTGPVSPPQKRDISLSYAKGEVLAFIDDDAYPAKEWLKNAIQNFRDPLVTAVGGPAITPPEDNLRRKASGKVYSSALVSGIYIYRYLPKKRQEIDDYPSCNLLVRKSVLQDLGGFKTKFWPGEDSKLCLDITKKLNKKIIYDPKAIVYHHRRPLFIAHLNQIANYALHRGYFVKRYPQTSLRIPYFIPSVFLLGLIAGFFLSLSAPIFRLYVCLIVIYLILVFASSLNKSPRLTIFVFLGIISTHLIYGSWFLKGLFSKRLKEE